MIEKNEAINLALGLMSEADMAYVSTIDEENRPQIRVMFNLRNKTQFPCLEKFFSNHDNDMLIYLGTNTSSAKIAQLLNNPSIAVCYRKNGEFFSLMLSGRAEVIEDMEIKSALWQNGWEMYYPKGASDPDYTVLRIIPLKGKGWYNGEAYNFRLG